jgi:hypothetical protein
MRRALGFVLALWAAAVGLGCGERKQVQPPAPAAAPAPKPAAPAEISATHPVVALDGLAMLHGSSQDALGDALREGVAGLLVVDVPVLAEAAGIRVHGE